jgi:hypothetical protein
MFPELAENQKFFPDISKFYPKITEFFRKHQNTKTNPIINQRPLGKKCNLIAQSLCSRKKGTFEKLGGGHVPPVHPPFLRHRMNPVVHGWIVLFQSLLDYCFCFYRLAFRQFMNSQRLSGFKAMTQFTFVLLILIDVPESK